MAPVNESTVIEMDTGSLLAQTNGQSKSGLPSMNGHTAPMNDTVISMDPSHPPQKPPLDVGHSTEGMLPPPPVPGVDYLDPNAIVSVSVWA